MKIDFNKEAMKEKIQKNMAIGHTITDIKRLLMEEQLANLKSMGVFEARNVELQDQIDFINEEYFPEVVNGDN